jgi:protein-S-isoprenylcysteine O-methyltransferase Ste14
MKNKAVLPPTVLLISIVIMLGFRFLLPVRMVIPLPWNLLGIAPLACGIALNLIADNAFRKANTTVKPFEESTVLLASGVFQISRHPMYLGFVLILIGIATMLRSLTSYVVVPVFVVLMDRVFIKVEDQMLEKKFGQAWLEYKQRVRRWV